MSTLPGVPLAPAPALPMSRLERLRRRIFSPTLRKLGELALTHTATFAFPLVFAIVCGRTLGIHDYGVVAFYTSVAAFLGMFVEFGFNWYGVREVAPNLDQPARCHRVLFNVTAAKLLLFVLAMGVTVLALGTIRGWHEWPLMLASGAYMLGFAADPAWYLQAHERTRTMLAVAASVRLSSIALLLAVMHFAGSTVAALWVYAGVSLAGSGIAWTMLFRHRMVQRARIELAYVRQLLKGAWAIVVGNLNGAVLTNGGVALLGLSADSATVASAALALRLRMAAEGVLLPLNQLGYVRLSARASESVPATFALGRRILVANLVMAVLLSLACMWAAPWVSEIVFKERVPLAIGLMILLALSLPIHSVAVLFGVQSLIALGRERRYAAIQTTASVLFCTLLLSNASASTYGWAVLATEALVLLSAGLSLVGIGRAQQRLTAGGGGATP